MIQSFTRAEHNYMVSNFSPLKPLPSSDMRIIRSTGQASCGGVLSSFVACYRIQVSSTLFPAKRSDCYDAYHFPDDNMFLLPDLYGSLEPRKYPNPGEQIEASRQFYLEMLKNSNTDHDYCHSYATNNYYLNVRTCYPQAFFIDASSIRDGHQVLIRIVTKEGDLNHVGEQTTLRIQRLKSNLWKHVKKLSLPIIKKITSSDSECKPVQDNSLTKEQCGNIGLQHGFEGGMYVVGKHVNSYARQDSHADTQYVKYKGTDQLLPGLKVMSKELCHLLSHHFHWETLLMRQTMRSFNELPPKCVGGKDGISKSFNVSVNLANPSHYDGHDFGVGVSVWMERVQYHPTDSYFILPNAMVSDIGNEKFTRHGVIIKLCDSCAISWDGSLIRHCTSVQTTPEHNN